MERLPVPEPVLDSLERDMLREVSNYVGAVVDSGTSYSSSIAMSVSPSNELTFRVELRRRRSRAGESLTHTYVVESSALQVIRTLAACPTWTHAEFIFSGSGLYDLIIAIYSLLHCSRSLSTLEIRLGQDNYFHHMRQYNYYYPRLLPELLYENPFLETLLLSPGVSPCREDAEALALCFMRNSVLKSCTLEANWGDSQTWEVALRPFTTSSKGEANVSLKELVLLEVQEMDGMGAISGEVLANLVRCNTTLERMEVRSTGIASSFIRTNRLAKALAVNHTLKEFRCNCSVVLLEELDGVLTPDSSGHQANTHLTALKLEPIMVYSQMGDYIKRLSRTLELSTTLNHVEILLCGVDNLSKIWEVRSLKPLQCYQKVSTQDMLEVMIRNELRVNTSLQSLVVGSWKLLREGGEWQMSYDGPCLARELPTADYNVKVTMRQ